MDLKRTGALIAQRRRELELTQSQLAELVGVTDKAISRWETGRGFPDAAYLQPLAQALGLSVTEIVNGELIQPEIAARQADDAVLSTLKYGRQMLRTVAAVLLATVGAAFTASPMYAVGANVGLLAALGVFLLALAAAVRFWKKGPSSRLAQLLAAVLLLIALVLQALPGSAVLVFAGPDYYDRNLYSCFDPMLCGYANFSPGLSAVLTAMCFVLLTVLLLTRKNGMRNSVFVCTIMAGVFMLVPPVLLGGEYMTPSAVAVVLLQFTAAFFQASANGNMAK